MTEDKQKRLNLLRYGLLVVVVVALTLTPAWFRIASLGLAGWGTVIMWTVLVTAVVAAICYGVYTAYKSMLLRS
jgi:hypothetical protein